MHFMRQNKFRRRAEPTGVVNRRGSRLNDKRSNLTRAAYKSEKRVVEKFSPSVINI